MKGYIVVLDDGVFNEETVLAEILKVPGVIFVSKETATRYEAYNRSETDGPYMAAYWKDEQGIEHSKYLGKVK